MTAPPNANDYDRFADGCFDKVLASLVLHYLQDWTVPLSEFRRILVHDGQLVISTHHPFMDYQLSGSDNYLATESYEEEWEVAGRDATRLMHFWRRPLTTMVEAFAAAGFRIETIQEPLLLAETRELVPEAYLRLTTRAQLSLLLATAL